MKRLLLSATALALLLLVTACAGDGSTKKGESRISGRAGVVVSSHHLAPPVGRRPGDQMPAN
jgi:hypothetical protein